MIIDLEKHEWSIFSSYRLEHICNEEILGNFITNEKIDFTIEEYENAQYNKGKLELVVGNIPGNVTENVLIKYFKNNGVKIIQVHFVKN